MEFTRFHYVCAVAEQRSFSRAAEKCFVSQPALTKSIGNLEKELGVKLFDRSTTPIRLTYAGERYIEGMKNVLAMKQQVDREMEEIANMKKGRLIIGTPSSRSATWLPHILPVYLENYPGISLQILEGDSTELEQLLVKETIDLALISTLPILTPGIDFEAIGEEELMIVMPSSHPLFRGKELSSQPGVLYQIPPEVLQDIPFISATHGQGLYRAAQQIFDRFQIQPKTILETVNPSTAVILASQGMGFAIITVRNMNESYPVTPVFCTLEDPPFKRTLTVSWKKDRPLSLAARHLIDTTKRIASTCPALQLEPCRVIPCPTPLKYPSGPNDPGSRR